MAKGTYKNEMFGYVDGKFINLYSKENPILNVGDMCYFLFNNISDIHRPIIGYGMIMVDKHIDGLNKLYFIQLHEIIETEKIQDKFVFNRQSIMLNGYNDNIITKSQRVHFLSKNLSNSFYSKNLFRIESFFIRPNYESIKQLQIEFMSVVKRDLQAQIADINELYLNYGIEETS